MTTVLHLRSSSGLYGAETMLLGLCREQARRGEAPVLAAFAPAPAAPPALLAEAGRRQLATRSLACRGRLDPRCVLRLRTLLRAGADVLHCHDYKSVAYAALAATGLPLARVATVHGWIGGDLRSGVYRRIEQRLLAGFDRVCAVSTPLAAELRAAGIPSGRLRCVPNGIDVERFRPAVSTDDTRESGEVRLGCAARLSPEKNLDLLVEALAAANARGARLRLTILGEGPERARLEALGASLIERGELRLPGSASGLERWYPELDAFVLPSATEGMPMSVLEALACGVPVLASAVGELPDMLAGLPGCRLLPPGDRAAWIDALAALRASEQPAPELRRRVVERWSLAAMADGYEQVYREALAA
jgi:glycosyltransferase involved in cell wall biosynthesis